MSICHFSIKFKYPTLSYSSGTYPKPSAFYALWCFQLCHWLFAHYKHGDGFNNGCISCFYFVCYTQEIQHFFGTSIHLNGHYSHCEYGMLSNGLRIIFEFPNKNWLIYTTFAFVRPCVQPVAITT